MTSPVIDAEFRSLIPPLSEGEYGQLSANLKQHGCLDTIKIWNGIVVDGHNRLNICEAENIPYTLQALEFTDREACSIWIIENQFGRRNLSPYARGLLALKLKEALARQAEEREKAGVRNPEQNSAQGRTNEKLAEISKLSHDTIHRIETIAQRASEKQKAALLAGDLSINEVYTSIRREEKRLEPKAAVALPEGSYDVILADPPWRYDFAETESRAIENHYPTMELEDICKLQIPSAPNAVLFLWATSPKLKEALHLMEAWGFEYKTNAIWDKEIIGMGYWFRGQHELLLIGIKGKFSPPAEDIRRSSVIRQKRTTHSSKPAIVYEIIEEYFPNGKYLELFSRNIREKWMGWGNE